MEDLRRTCVCGCLGLQHKISHFNSAMNASQASGSTAGPEPIHRPATASAPVPESTASEPLTSRPTVKSFSAGAKARKEAMQKDFESNPKKNPFEPALKIFEKINQDNRTTVPPRKRKRSQSDTKKPTLPSQGPTKKAKVAPTGGSTIFTFVMMPDTPTVELGETLTPTNAGLQSLYGAGYVKRVTLDDTLDGFAIAELIKKAFCSLPSDPVLPFAPYIPQFQWYISQSRGRGLSGILELTGSAPYIDVPGLLMGRCMSRTIDSKMYPTRVFISLAAGGPSMPMPTNRRKRARGDDDSGTESQDGESGDKDKHKSKTRKKDNTPASPEDTDDELPPNPFDGIPGPIPEAVTHARLLGAVRTIRYLCQPPKMSHHWATSTAKAADGWKTLNLNISNVTLRLERVELSESYTIGRLVSLIQRVIEEDELFSSMVFLELLYVQLTTGSSEDSTGEDNFKDTFTLGPYGVNPLIDFLHRLFSVTRTHRADIPSQVYDQFYQAISVAAQQLAFLLETWSQTITKSNQWGTFYPDDFREFFDALRVRVSLGGLDYCIDEEDGYLCLEFPFSSEAHRPVTFFVRRFTIDFGSATEASAMDIGKFKLGQFALDGIASAMRRFLDGSALDDFHKEVFPILALLAAQLARKLVNFKKSRKGGSNDTEGDESASEETEKGKERAAGSVPPEPRRSSRHQQQASSDTPPETEEDRSRRSPGYYEFVPDAKERARFSENNSQPRPDSDPKPETKRPKPKPTQNHEWKYANGPRGGAPAASASLPSLGPELSCQNWEERVLSLRRWPADSVCQRILEWFPHPNPSKRKVWSDISGLKSSDKRWRTMTLVRARTLLF
ncbi:hypothetical protein C8J56DRAFT_1084812, partial [Mycena floridula]